MEVKSISPVALSNPVRGQRPEAIEPPRARPSASSGAPKELKTNEIQGQLARSLLRESGVEQADLAKYRVNLDIDGDTGRVIAEIRDRHSGDLVSEVPSRTLLRQAAMLQETLGTILDKPV